MPGRLLTWKQVLLLIALPAVPALLVATQPFSSDDSTTEGAVRCRALEEQTLACMAGKLERLVASDGVPAALDSLEDEVNDGDSPDCHQLTHVIGRAATERYPTVSVAFRAGSQMCGAGYYHGAMEGIVQELGRRRVTQRIPVLCTALRKERKYGIRRYSCAHGLGHGLHSISDGVRAAIGRCKRFRDSSERRYCYSGVFMENTRPHGGTGRRASPKSGSGTSVPRSRGAPRPSATSACHRTRHSPPRRTSARSSPCAKRFAAPVRSDCEKGLGALSANLGMIKGGKSPERYAVSAGLCRLPKADGAEARCFLGAAVTFIYNERSMPGAQALCLQADPSVRRPCLRVAFERLQRLYGRQTLVLG